MAQNYKIFINELPVIIIHGNTIEKHVSDNDLNPAYSFTQKQEINKAFHLIENHAHIKSLTIYGEDVKEIKKYLFQGYKKIKAAGGLVFNNKGEILMIFRNHMWDLPKGKIDVGEKKKIAALREVREETGLQKISILKKLIKTYHTYLLGNNIKVLKVIHWYLMMSNDEEILKPQEEEGIEIVRWVDVNNLNEKLKKTYANISNVITTGVTMMLQG